MPESRLVTTVTATPRTSAGPLTGAASEPALAPLLELLPLELDPPEEPFAVPVDDAAPERVAEPVAEPEMDAATEEADATQSGHPPQNRARTRRTCTRAARVRRERREADRGGGLAEDGVDVLEERVADDPREAVGVARHV